MNSGGVTAIPNGVSWSRIILPENPAQNTGSKGWPRSFGSSKKTHTSVSQTANFSLRSVPSIDARAGHDLCLFEPVTVANPTEEGTLRFIYWSFPPEFSEERLDATASLARANSAMWRGPHIAVASLLTYWGEGRLEGSWA
jgi:hypothetical protein